ncbi:hypothetical protein BX616_008324 [Lobosporangium transversale]|uniref:Ran guanine nucleotide release factor n=1 Tax=Lobosporangium transversale TaxID=64571 RepID=A0A1Y2GM14_9FUNG|nr:hypothetical protein BCR41DRAFT_387005 [Lobosporangium transversale]KAF9896007.1 hypothetical protein BX616_008324 [Lobosporangium transversale]ORZ13758.1 hypothetical protein BCR41DRAFT_387005 [Lobosporangium transversale]|eukprot:XP_021880542.1 hypothetical protein BCR41DRAFT_387005 [Lobosporangium transversale]
MATVERELFGGAITLNLPPKFDDISQFREVPDHQEVFVNADEDQSVIVEILEMVDTADDACAAYHYQQLAEDNDAEDSSVVQSVSVLSNSELPQWPIEAKLYLLLGQQRIAKYNERQTRAIGGDARNLVQIMMVVIRLPLQQTDIVISYNVPLQISEISSSREVAHAGDIQEAELWFRTLLGSFQVKNWGLFGSN